MELILYDNEPTGPAPAEMNLDNLIAWLRDKGWEVEPNEMWMDGYCCVEPERRGGMGLFQAVKTQMTHEIEAAFVAYRRAKREGGYA